MKVTFYTLGCKVNQYETQGLKEEFLKLGWQVVKEGADLYVVNSCTVTYRADVKCKDLIKKIKKNNPKVRIAVVGCLAQLNKDFLKKLDIDYIIPQDKKQYLADIVSGVNSKKDKNIWDLKINSFVNKRVFLKVQDGCDNFCSYCKIPYLRGKPQSRPFEDVINEVKRISINHNEIILCGINLALYGKDLKSKKKLSDLIKAIVDVDTVKRIRLSSLEPNLVDEDILSFLAHEKLCPHLHLPFQAGDDFVLSKMNKKVKVENYSKVVEKARKINKDVAISCDILTGFAYEEDNHFQNTYNFIKEISPMRMHIFGFSPREKTEFEGMKIKTSIINQRSKKLKQLAESCAQNYSRKFIGKTLTMIAEEKKKGLVLGYTENYLKAQLDDKVIIGDMVKVKVVKAFADKIIVEQVSSI